MKSLSRRQFTKQGLLWLASGPAILRAQDVVPNRRKGGFSLPQLANLVLKLESTDFDSTSNATNILLWSDHSGLGHDLNLTGVALLGNPNNPKVDGVTLCNGHHTVRFDGTMCIGNNNNAMFSNAATGMEQMIVFVNDADPPTNVPAGANGAFFNLLLPGTGGTFGCLAPFTDGNFYESFGRTDRPSIGNPATTTAGSFCCYDVTSRQDGTLYSAWINSENFFSTGVGYTYNKTQMSNALEARIGAVYTGVTNLFGKGNVAAVYAWQVPLSASERSQARAYIKNKWGTSFGF